MSCFGNIQRPVMPKQPKVCKSRDKTKARKSKCKKTKPLNESLITFVPDMIKDSYWLDQGDARKLPRLITVIEAF